jgi:hypothetical protein
MTKGNIGFVILCVAVANIFWAAKIHRLGKASQQNPADEGVKKEIRKLNWMSRASLFAVGCIALIWIIVEGK